MENLTSTNIAMSAAQEKNECRPQWNEYQPEEIKKWHKFHWSSQEEFEEWMDMLDRQLMGITTVVDQYAQNLWGLTSDIQAEIRQYKK
jgi:broad specificity phosphatase PhoE